MVQHVETEIIQDYNKNLLVYSKTTGNITWPPGKIWK